jgi:hypothetical protein
LVPALQREDGSYIGTDGYMNLIALGLDGSVLWQQTVGTAPIAPLYATADGGAVVTSTIQCAHNVVTDTPCSPQLGTLYTVDQNGNVSSQTPDTGAVYSWTNQWYDPTPSATTVSAATLPPIYLASSFWAVLWGNLSNIVAVPQAWFPPLDPTKNTDIYNALYDMIRRVAVKAISDKAQDNIFNELSKSTAKKLETKDFLLYLNSKRPRFYNGTTSTYCHEALTGGPCFFIPPFTWFNGQSVQDYMEANPDHEAETGTPSNPLLTFFRPSSILDASQGDNLGNEANVFHEALHGITGLEDMQILSILGFKTDLQGASCRISKRIEDTVLRYSEGLDQTTDSKSCPDLP